jgi:hypothetical protein
MKGQQPKGKIMGFYKTSVTAKDAGDEIKNSFSNKDINGESVFLYEFVPGVRFSLTLEDTTKDGLKYFIYKESDNFNENLLNEIVKNFNSTLFKKVKAMTTKYFKQIEIKVFMTYVTDDIIQKYSVDKNNMIMVSDIFLNENYLDSSFVDEMCEEFDVPRLPLLVKTKNYAPTMAKAFFSTPSRVLKGKNVEAVYIKKDLEILDEFADRVVSLEVWEDSDFFEDMYLKKTTTYTTKTTPNNYVKQRFASGAERFLKLIYDKNYGMANTIYLIISNYKTDFNTKDKKNIGKTITKTMKNFMTFYNKTIKENLLYKENKILFEKELRKILGKDINKVLFQK